MPEVTLIDAINLALGRALADDPDVVVFGEDVGVTVVGTTCACANAMRCD
jgi:pyruvate/2-oxoglutarate/acetoin dehydrogenase E1 component